MFTFFVWRLMNVFRVMVCVAVLMCDVCDPSCDDTWMGSVKDFNPEPLPTNPYNCDPVCPGG